MKDNQQEILQAMLKVKEFLYKRLYKHAARKCLQKPQDAVAGADAF